MPFLPPLWPRNVLDLIRQSGWRSRAWPSSSSLFFFPLENASWLHQRAGSSSFLPISDRSARPLFFFSVSPFFLTLSRHWATSSLLSSGCCELSFLFCVRQNVFFTVRSPPEIGRYPSAFSFSLSLYRKASPFPAPPVLGVDDVPRSNNQSPPVPLFFS